MGRVHRSLSQKYIFKNPLMPTKRPNHANLALRLMLFPVYNVQPLQTNLIESGKDQMWMNALECVYICQMLRTSVPPLKAL